MQTPMQNRTAKDRIDTAKPEEVARFSALAATWWDPEGGMKPLHAMSPARLTYARERLLAHFDRKDEGFTPFQGLNLLDIGCGGGLFSEPMARLGFNVTGIDASAEAIKVASAHAEAEGLSITYRNMQPEALAAADARFDVVLAMEIVEHVADLDAFLTACARLVRPGGAFLGATLNRTAKSFALAIVGAEYLLRWLPPGTHDWKHFVKPSEFARGLRRGGVNVQDFRGMVYSPTTASWRLGSDLDVNYLVYGKQAD